MNPLSIRRTLAFLPLSLLFAVGASQASTPRDIRGLQHTDYTRLPGVGLLVNESMLGTMDERLGMDADARSTERKFWLRYGSESQGGGKGVNNRAHAGGRYSAVSLQLGTDFYRTSTDRAGVFASLGAGGFGKSVDVGKYSLDRPRVSGYGLGLYYNHNSLAGWYVDGAILVSRLSGGYGQTGTYNLDGPGSPVATRANTADVSTTAVALQGEVGYRMSFSSGASVTPKLRIDHHRMRLGTAKNNRILGETRYGALNKTGIYYGARLAQDWPTASGKIRVWVEPGITHTRGARVAFTHIDFMDQNRDAGTRNLNATRIGLGLGVEGSITRPQDLRLEGRINRAVGKSNGGGSAVMASWNMRF
ncbi:MAG: autotransporter outer membrane beta-barrel domain-containing protein [Burkholderiaceae bacterium]|nr:autotransporter outer membrane beta-barrel domain-containing protein [Burkholderiaceae bacterium]